MSNRVKLTIAGPLMMVLLLAATSGIVFALSSEAGNQIIEQTIVRSGQTVSSTVSRTLFNALYVLDINAMRSTLDQLVTDETIVYAEVRGPDGNIVAVSKVDWIPRQVFLRDLASQAFARREPASKRLETRYLGLSAPLAAGSEQIGTLGIVFD